MHKKIFWLEDHPHFGTIEDIWELSGKKISKKTLLENSVFAYDFVSAEKILSSGDEFDLYITDGDFPRDMPESQKRRVDDYLKKLKDIEECEYAGYLEGGFQNQYPNAFVELGINHFLDKNFVVHSMSRDAKVLSFLLGWPFYAKYLGDEKFDMSSENQNLFYHNDVTGKLPPRIFDKVYDFISKNPLWQPSKNHPKFFELRKNPEMIESWEHGGAKELVQNRIVPLFE